MQLFVKNSLSGVLQLVLTACLTFYSIPLFITNLGTELYGVYAVVGVVGNLNVIINLGLNTSLLRFLGQQGKCRESDHDIAATIVLLATVLIPISSLALYFRQSIMIYALGLSEPLFKQAEGLYLGVVTANVLLIIGQTFTTLLDVRQRTYLVNTFQFCYSLLYWSGTIALLHLGFGLNEVGICITGSATVWLLLVVVAAHRHWGRLDLTDFKRTFLQSARKQLRYGANVYSAGLLSFLYEPLTKLILAQLFGVTAAGYYDIASRIKTQLYGLASRALYPLYPWVTKQTSFDVIRGVFKRVQHKLLFLAIPLCMLLYVYTPHVLTLWLGATDPAIAWTLIGLTTSYFLLSVPVIPTYYFLTAKGLARHTAVVQLINVTVNLTVLFVGRPWLGFYAVVAGHVLAQASSFIYLQYCQRTYLGMYAVESPKQLVQLVQFSLLLGGFLTGLQMWSINAFAFMFILPVATLLISLFLYRRMGVFSTIEIERLLGKGTAVNSLAQSILVKSF